MTEVIENLCNTQKYTKKPSQKSLLNNSLKTPAMISRIKSLNIYA